SAASGHDRCDGDVERSIGPARRAGMLKLLAPARRGRLEAGRPFRRDGLIQRVRPFALVGTFAVLAVAILPPAPNAPLLLAAAAAALVTLGFAFVIDRAGLPPSLDFIPPLASVAALTFLQHAAGGTEAGLVPLLALPIVWVALHGSRWQMLVVLAASVVAVVVPILLTGGPAGANGEWRRATIDAAVGALVIVTVGDLVTRLREERGREVERVTQLAAQEAALASILETAQEAIVAFLWDGRILSVNPAACTMFRGGRDALVGRDLIDTLAVESERERLRETLARLTIEDDASTPRLFQTELLRLDGDTFPAEVSVAVAQSSDGPVVNAFARDTSERVRSADITARQLNDLQSLLSVARELGTPEEAPFVRRTICDVALRVSDAAMALLFEPLEADLILTASSGRGVELESVPRDGSSTGIARVAETGEPMFSGRLRGDDRVSTRYTEATGARAGYWQPIRGGGEVSGVLVVLWDDELEVLDARVETLLNILASQAGVALEMTKLVDGLRDLARTDGLTGIANRRTFDESVRSEVDRAARSGRPLSLILLDLDHFKRFNDAHGHQAGDAQLVGATAAWGKELRPADVLARYGGEDIAVLLPDCPPEAALLIAGRLRSDVPGGETVSAGDATLGDGETAESLIGRADTALYRAKAAGRDQAVAA
ncbi:MAG: diguanylate cyclase, partial [Candidatus Limnocylindrales bacterium]